MSQTNGGNVVAAPVATIETIGQELLDSLGKLADELLNLRVTTAIGAVTSSNLTDIRNNITITFTGTQRKWLPPRSTCCWAIVQPYGRKVLWTGALRAVAQGCGRRCARHQHRDDQHDRQGNRAGLVDAKGFRDRQPSASGKR